MRILHRTVITKSNCFAISEVSYLHVSYERVLSGPGLHAIYEYLRDRRKMNRRGWQKKSKPAIRPRRSRRRGSRARRKSPNRRWICSPLSMEQKPAILALKAHGDQRRLRRRRHRTEAVAQAERRYIHERLHQQRPLQAIDDLRFP